MDYEFKAFPKIGQFADTVRRVRSTHDYTGVDDVGDATYEHTTPYPTIKFHGTVKLHGTNAALVMTDEGVFTQSRSRKLTIQNDNAGFAAFVAGLPPRVVELLWHKNYAVYGEWCGGTIQKGVALNKLDKMFMIFAVRDLVTANWLNVGWDTHELQVMNAFHVHHINQCPSYVLDIDFNNPEAAAEKMAELTVDVEKQCPVGTCFGVRGVGEGVVWKPLVEDVTTANNSSRLWFKVKGDKHKATRTKEKVPVDVEKVASVKEFVSATVTPARLEQGLSVLRESGNAVIVQNTGLFMKWVVNDILTEEAYLLGSSGLCKRDVSHGLSNAVRVYWEQQVAANGYEL